MMPLHLPNHMVVGGGGSDLKWGRDEGRGQSSMGTSLYEDGEPHDALDYRQRNLNGKWHTPYTRLKV